MTQTTLFLEELLKEAETTRKMLARVPNEQLDWAPHPKSMTLRRLVTHIAEIPGWPAMALETEGLDFASNPYAVTPKENIEEAIRFFEESLAKGKAALEKATDQDLAADWTLRNGEYVINVTPKKDVVRMSLSQTIHHRAQLGVFLRLLDVTIPGSYGPSADESVGF